MPYHIILRVEPEYEIKKNNWFYSLYYDIKSFFVYNDHSTYKSILIDTVNTEYEVICEVFQYLVSHKYGGLYFESFLEDVNQEYYDTEEINFVEQTYMYYDDNSKDLDEDTYMNLKFIEFLIKKTSSIDDIHNTCVKYCNESYQHNWNLEYEFTE